VSGYRRATGPAFAQMGQDSANHCRVGDLGNHLHGAPTLGTPAQLDIEYARLTDARFFQGRDSILSGPAGGVVGAVRTAATLGLDRIIGFDMGGTSTDVSHYAGEYERAFETEVAGVRMRAPMMRINTVAAGGGSILHFDGSRYRVGPDSAGADPGPACYRRSGPLTVTDCNVMALLRDPRLSFRVATSAVPARSEALHKARE